MKLIAICAGMFCLTAGRAGAETPPQPFEVVVAQGVLNSKNAIGSNLQARQASPYCLATFKAAEEGFPKYWYNIDCKDGREFPSASKICWSLSDTGYQKCVAEIADKTKELMRNNGYAELGGFKFQGDIVADYVFQRSVNAQGQKLCLARRSVTDRLFQTTSFRVEYTIDCGDPDGNLTSLTNIEPDRNGTDGIRRHMSQRGYSFAESFTDKHGYLKKLIFQQP